MFNNVLIGVDEQGGSDAIALAKQLVSEHGTLTLAHVFRGSDEGWRGPCPPPDAIEEGRIQANLEQAADAAGIEPQLRWHGASNAGRGLHELAESVAADLLVVGSSRRGLFGRVLLGDDTRTALNGAPCAVAIAPAGYAREPSAMREIGVAYNEAPESHHALTVGRSLASELHAKLSAFEAVSIPAFALGSGVAIGDTLNAIVDDARERVGAQEGVEPHAAFGNPADELAWYSASIDLLVVGSRGYGPVGRLVHGSTAQKLARTARCPLLILTRAARAELATTTDVATVATTTP